MSKEKKSVVHHENHMILHALSKWKVLSLILKAGRFLYSESKLGAGSKKRGLKTEDFAFVLLLNTLATTSKPAV